MKISSVQEFHSFVSSFKSLLSSLGIQIKTSRAQELLAKSFGYNSANDLYSKLPIRHILKQDDFTNLVNKLVEHHNVNSVDRVKLRKILEAKFGINFTYGHSLRQRSSLLRPEVLSIDEIVRLMAASKTPNIVLFLVLRILVGYE
jgi:hypothetical protein